MMNWDLLVEATISCIYFDVENKQVRIDLSTSVHKASYSICAVGIDYFYAQDMSLANIVDRVNIFTGIECDKEFLIKHVLFLMQRREVRSTDLEWKPLKDRITAILDGTLNLMVIEPVNGVEISILAKAITLKEI